MTNLLDIGDKMSEKLILAKSKANEITDSGACGGAVSSIFQYLLANEIVDGVLTLNKGIDVYDGVPRLLTSAEEVIETCGSLHCAPTMVSDLISDFLADEKIAVAVKPCDAKAINELVKRHRIDGDKIITVGLNCGGTVRPEVAQEMIEKFYKVDPSKVVKEEIDKGKFIIELDDGEEIGIKIDDLEEEGYGRRDNCQRCELKVPRNADIACGNWGSEPGWTFVEINTEKGQEIIDGAIAEGFIETKAPSEKALEMREKVENIMIKMGKKNTGKQLDDGLSLEEWEAQWNKCIKCFACRDVCPICWCHECELEKAYFKDDPQSPPDPLGFHGVRLSHMSPSCINCGQCDDVCPMEIPVSKLFHKLQKKYEGHTGYVAGIGDEKPPLYSPMKEDF